MKRFTLKDSLLKGGLLRTIAIYVGVVRSLSLGVFLLFFSLMVLYVLPVNPLRVAWKGFFDRSIGTYFWQTWTLFGPNPISSNYSLLACPLGESTAQSDISSTQLTCYNLTTPLWNLYQHNRFSSYDRLGRTQRSPMINYLFVRPELYPWAQACRETRDATECATFTKVQSQDKKRALLLLQRIASSFCNGLSHSDRFSRVAIRILIEDPVPWSKRFSAEHVAHVMNLGIFPINKSVMPARFYALPDSKLQQVTQ